LLALAETVDFVGGVVGWVDLTAPDGGDLLAELCESPHLVGIRHHVHDEPDPEWLLRADVQRGLRAVERQASRTTSCSARASCPPVSQSRAPSRS
jgi:L-fuconolactonase